MSLQCFPLPYAADGAELFARLRALPWAMWLDGGGAGVSRYEIFVAAPRRTLVSRAGISELADADGLRLRGDDPLALLGELLSAGARPPLPGVPFSGGAVGYFGYDLGLRLEGLDDARPAQTLPELAVGLYDWAIVTDHAERRTYWAGAADAAERTRLFGLLERPAAAVAGFLPGELLERPREAEYRTAFERVQAYIGAGDCYQVNLARPFRAAYGGDPWGGYRRLRELSPAPFGAYLELPFVRVLSNSPERFLELREGRVETRPIKGTRPRRAEPAADARERAALAASSKDRAENVMIVDLLRNDLGKSCRTGSVRVSQLCQVESYASVHHLVSAVTAELAPGLAAVDLLRGCLPGGSITGAPKRRAMEIIRELEPQRRGAYCGAIGYLGYDGAMDTNIAIRTLVCADGQCSYWAGGGVVADSTAAAEFAEIEAKAAAFLRLWGLDG